MTEPASRAARTIVSAIAIPTAFAARDDHLLLVGTWCWPREDGKIAALRAGLRTLRPSVLITNERVAERLAGECERGRRA